LFGWLRPWRIDMRAVKAPAPAGAWFDSRSQRTNPVSRKAKRGPSGTGDSLAVGEERSPLGQDVKRPDAAKRRASLRAGRAPKVGLASIHWRTDDSLPPHFMRPNSALHPQADEQATATQNRKPFIGTADPGVGRKYQQSRAGVSFQHPDYPKTSPEKLFPPGSSSPAGGKLLDNTCPHRTGRHEENSYWPGYE
jgi:hypothetical protein